MTLVSGISMGFSDAVLVKFCGPKQLLNNFSSEVGEMAWCVRELTALQGPGLSSQLPCYSSQPFVI